MHTAIPPADRPEYERNLAAAHTALTDDEWQAEWSQGEAMSMKDAVAYALEV